MHALVAMHGQPGWVVALTPLSVDGMLPRPRRSWLNLGQAAGAGCCRGRCWLWAAWRAWPPRRGRTAHGHRAADRRVAVIRADLLLRALDAARVANRDRGRPPGRSIISSSAWTDGGSGHEYRRSWRRTWRPAPGRP